MNGIRNLVLTTLSLLALVLALGACSSLGIATTSDVAGLRQQVTAVQVSLGQLGDKPDKAYVDAELAKRPTLDAMKSAMTEVATGAEAGRLALETKIGEQVKATDASVVALGNELRGQLAGQAAQVQTLVSAVETKADSTRLDAELAKKADKATVDTVAAKVEKKADEDRVRKLEVRVVTTEELIAAVSAPQRDAKAEAVIKQFMAEHGATEFIALNRFELGSDDIGAAFKAAPKNVRDAIEALPGRIEKKEVSVIATYGGQDAVPCRDKKCANLAERRARALAAKVKAPKAAVIKTVRQPDELIHRGAELRFAFVLLKDGTPQAPPPPPAASPASGGAPGAAAPAAQPPAPSAAAPAGTPPPLGAPAPRP